MSTDKEVNMKSDEIKAPGAEQAPAAWKGPAFVVAKGDPTKDSVINTISLFIDENKQFIQYGLYTLAAAGIIKIGR